MLCRPRGGSSLLRAPLSFHSLSPHSGHRQESWAHGPSEATLYSSQASAGATRSPEAAPRQALSLTILGFHTEAESQVLVTVQQPAVTGCRDVQHQPALVPSSERLKIQKEQVRLPVDTKEQLTEGAKARHRASVCLLPTSGALLEHLAALALGWAPLVPYFTSNSKMCYCTHVQMGKLRLNGSVTHPRPPIRTAR